MKQNLTTWDDIQKTAAEGNPEAPRRVEKTEAEWQAQLSTEEYHVTRLQGTEQPFSSDSCAAFEPGIYNCRCCGTPLFDGGEKFDSGTGWPSFTQPLKENVVAYEMDKSHGQIRIEALCNICDSHLGHVFPDGPEPSGLRYCLNAVSLKKADESAAADESAHESVATFGGGCFWFTEALFQALDGVFEVTSGYAGGNTDDPSYRAVCTGQTGHAEVIQVTYDPGKISYAELLRVHLATHDPTTMNRQGSDTGTQYRSIIFYRNEEERAQAEKILAEAEGQVGGDIVTELEKLDHFHPAEENHQNYYVDNPNNPYCSVNIEPKLAKLRKKFGELIRS